MPVLHGWDGDPSINLGRGMLTAYSVFPQQSLNDLLMSHLHINRVQFLSTGCLFFPVAKKFAVILFTRRAAYLDALRPLLSNQ